MTAVVGASPVDSAIGSLPVTDLASLVRLADLQRRFDHKFIVDRDFLPGLLAALDGNVRVLEVAGRRATNYTSVYFDTAGLRLYRDHLQRRRRRFKIRTRHYGDAGATMLEVKCKGQRGQSVKYRSPHPGTSPAELNAQAKEFINNALMRQYQFAVPTGLAPVVVNRFERVTLVDFDAGERMTIDLNLSVEANGRTVRLDADRAVLETKSLKRFGPMTRTIMRHGPRPLRMSKYCVGIAASHGHVRANPWLPALRLLVLSQPPA